MPTTTETATHVYLKEDNPKGLLQSYRGPYRIVGRPSQSTIKVKMGTFKSGHENIQLHHWSNAKPAEMREDAVEAEMPKRGRPSKSTHPSSDPASAKNLKLQTQTSDTFPSTSPVASANDNGPKQTDVNINKARQPLAPTRRSERIKRQNHATSTVNVDSLALSAPTVGSAPNLNVGSTPADRIHLYWSPTKAEIEALNYAINQKRYT